eukprot:Plantae.Rhodophyta-Rhodochaete_pulchella.ctg14585.p1 GENE.Plantae.Rhodophyta-Rhodochaete_pulchella.ctg14585~~Plantae.Rhodophyta-Rhodochaete_pulchella.ctg14585.p1  ORF type:complete len:461 (+),score=48.44 Plantae.Rhodophyta-Rhodochaete_pulchella.ctg14585:489-1871(+)
MISTMEGLSRILGFWKYTLRLSPIENFLTARVWARTQFKSEYSFRCGMEMSFHLCESALDTVSIEHDPKLYTVICAAMANALLLRIAGDRKTNIEEAIRYSRCAIGGKVHLSKGLYAMVRMRLGIAFQSRLAGDRNESLVEAISCYRTALVLIDRVTLPREWAAIQTNLGNALQERQSGDRSASMDEAILCYREALTLGSEDKFLVDRAVAMVNLGVAYRNCLSGDHQKNLTEAASCHEIALQVITRERLPALWAVAELNSANVLRGRDSKREHSVRKAMASYAATRSVSVRPTVDLDWDQFQIDLGVSWTSGVPRSWALKLLNDKGMEPPDILITETFGAASALEVITKDCADEPRNCGLTPLTQAAIRGEALCAEVTNPNNSQFEGQIYEQDLSSTIRAVVDAVSELQNLEELSEQGDCLSGAWWELNRGMKLLANEIALSRKTTSKSSIMSLRAAGQ